MSQYLVIAAPTFGNIHIQTWRAPTLKAALQKACDGINATYWAEPIMKMKISIKDDVIKMSSPCYKRKLETSIHEHYLIAQYMSDVYMDDQLGGNVVFKIEEI